MTITNRTALKATATIIASSAVLALTACSSSSTKHAGNVGSIRSNPSPAMHSLAQRSSDRNNMFSRTFDTDVRAMNNDIDSVFHLNRPSRLTRYPKPY